MEIMRRNAVVKNPGIKQRVQRILGDCRQWKSKGQCSRGDTCSFRHEINKRAKMTQPNPSPNSFMQQNERNASRTRSPRGKSPSGRMSRWPCKDYLKGTCTNSFCKKWHPPECLFYKTKSDCRFGEKCSNENYTTIGLRISRYVAAEVVIDFMEELRNTETDPMCKIHKSRCTSRWHSRPKSIARNDFAQVNLISVTPMLQNLRIGLRRRQSGKSKVPVKQRGGWPKVC